MSIDFKKNVFDWVVIHPYLFAVLPVMKVWETCSGAYLPEDYLFLIAAIFALIFLLHAMAFIYFRNAQKSGIAVSVFVGMVYLWIGFEAVCKTVLADKSPDPLITMLVYVALCANALFVILKWAPVPKLTLALNLYSLFVVVVAVVPITGAESKMAKRSDEVVALVRNEFKDVKLQPPAQKPDIYFILADAFANQHTLEELYKYDSPFVEHLEKKGFYVCDQATAVHDRTGSSLPSTLNMRYMMDVLKMPGIEGETFFRLIQHNEVAHLLQQAGYRYVNVSSGWEPTDFNRAADENVGFSLGGVLHIALLRLTMLMGFEDRFHPLGYLFKASRMRTFDSMEQYIPSRSPKFVLVHCELPHAPLFLDKDGKVTHLDMRMMNDPYTVETYLQQLRFSEKQLTRLVDRLLAQAGPQPIIIIESDHGPALLVDSGKPEYINERMRILSAFHLPEQMKTHPPQNLSAVNTFRWLFDNYFGTKLGLLDNKSYAAIPFGDEHNAKDVYSEISFPKGEIKN